MTKTQAEDQLKLVLMNALRLAPPGASRTWVASKVFDTERRLLTELFRHWAIERMIRMLDRLDAKPAPSQQIPIPGFEDLPRRIAVEEKPRPGRKLPRRVALKDATLKQLVEYRKLLAKTRDERLERLDQLIAFMRKHRQSRKDTLGAVLEQYKFEFTAVGEEQATKVKGEGTK